MSKSPYKGSKINRQWSAVKTFIRLQMWMFTRHWRVSHQFFLVPIYWATLRTLQQGTPGRFRRSCSKTFVTRKNVSMDEISDGHLRRALIAWLSKTGWADYLVDHYVTRKRFYRRKWSSGNTSPEIGLNKTRRAHSVLSSYPALLPQALPACLLLAKLRIRFSPFYDTFCHQQLTLLRHNTVTSKHNVQV